MCANEEGYAGSGRDEEASVLDTLDSEGCPGGPCDDSVVAFGSWNSPVDREANHDLKTVKSMGGESFSLLRRYHECQQRNGKMK